MGLSSRGPRRCCCSAGGHVDHTVSILELYVIRDEMCLIRDEMCLIRNEMCSMGVLSIDRIDQWQSAPLLRLGVES